MPTCQNGHQKWSWKQTVKKSLTLYGMTCPHCAEKQHLSARSRKRDLIIPLIVVPLIALGNAFFDRTFVILFALLGVLPLLLIINPFFVELSNEKEPLF